MEVKLEQDEPMSGQTFTTSPASQEARLSIVGLYRMHLIPSCPDSCEMRSCCSMSITEDQMNKEFVLEAETTNSSVRPAKQQVSRDSNPCSNPSAFN